LLMSQKSIAPPSFDGEAETHSLLSTNDWSASPLGHPQIWPRELHTIVDLLIGSKFPMFVAWGPKLGFLYNDAYAAIMGNKHPHGFGRRFEEVWAEIWTDISPIIDDALAGRSSYFEDLPLTVLRNGYPERAWFTFSYSPVRDSSGMVAGMYCAVAETSIRVVKLADRVRPLTVADDVTATACELLGLHVEVSRVLYAEVDDRAGTFSIRQDWLNRSIPSIAGETRRLDDFGPEIIAQLRAGKPMIVDDIALDSRTARHVDAYAKIGVRSNLAIPLVKDGRMIAILSLQNDEPRHWAADEVELAQDVVERTWTAVARANAEAELRTQTEKLQIATQAAKLGLFDHNLLTGELKWSDRVHEHVGQPRNMEVSRESFFKHVHPDDRGPILELLEALYAPGNDGRVDMEYRVINADGRQRWVAAAGQMFYDSAGRPVRLVGTTADITERKQNEHELKEAGRRKDEFLAMLAHELRNPLAPIGTAAELLQVAKLSEARVRHTSEIIARQVNHMTSLIDDLLDVSRVTSGLIELDKTPLDIRHIVNDAVEQVTPLIQSRRHHLALHLSPAPAMVTGDKKRLVQVIANLLNNAAKYTNAHGNIVLKTHVLADHILLEVADDGIGMAPELVSRVFELFAQAERTSDRSLGGLGLGLALVKSLVELHGGAVTCVSAGIGKGSRFTVSLPCLPCQDEGADNQPIENHLQRASRPLRVMVVDDNVDAAAMLTVLLESLGHQVLVEHGSKRALEAARAERLDAFLLDIGLPEMDGNELAQRLRAQPETAKAVLIAVTGYGQDSDRKNTMASGFDHHLVKPISITKLAAILAQIGEFPSGRQRS